ncbi:MAG: tetratricopeptide repeat protein [Algibacter sp.]
MQDQDYILFETYLLEELSQEDVASFESRLKTDSEFNDAFNSYKALSSFLEHKFENEEATNAFQKNLTNISNTHFNKDKAVTEVKGTGKTFQFYKYAIAACVVVLFGIFTFNQFSNPSYSDFSNYDAVSLTVRGDNDDLLKTAENAFNAKDFASAEAVFKQLIAKDESNAEIKLYSAISNIELNNFASAEALLQDLKNGNSAFKNKATWFLALSKLKQNDNAACIVILKTIPEDAENYKQAQKLIDKLD